MANEILEAEQAQAQAIVQKAKAKKEREMIKIKLTGAASCTIENCTFAKGVVINIDKELADRFLDTGLFEII